MSSTSNISPSEPESSRAQASALEQERVEELRATNEVYLNTWKKSIYTSIVMLGYIIGQLFSVAGGNPWLAFLAQLDAMVEGHLAGDTLWDKASNMMQTGGIQYLFKGFKKPKNWGTIPTGLWENGVGLCTSFSIAVNRSSGVNGNYVDYRGQHRAAHKDRDEDVLVIDSSAGAAFNLRPGEIRTNKDGTPWVNDNGLVRWSKDERTPRGCKDWQDAMSKCLDQLFSKAKFGVTLLRTLNEDGSEGIFCGILQFCPRHRVFKMLKFAETGVMKFRYIVFARNHRDTGVARQELQRFLASSDREKCHLFFAELDLIWEAAVQRWGPARLSKVFSVPTSDWGYTWPTPEIDDDEDFEFALFPLLEAFL